MIKSFKDLDVWKKSMKLAKSVYNLTNAFPKDELYGLTNQMRRAAVSIPSNIAEGYARRSASSYRHFLLIASGSKCELETQILLSIGIGYVNSDVTSDIMHLLEDVGRMLNMLIYKLEDKG